MKFPSCQTSTSRPKSMTRQTMSQDSALPPIQYKFIKTNIEHRITSPLAHKPHQLHQSQPKIEQKAPQRHKSQHTINQEFPPANNATAPSVRQTKSATTENNPTSSTSHITPLAVELTSPHFEQPHQNLKHHLSQKATRPLIPQAPQADKLK